MHFVWCARNLNTSYVIVYRQYELNLRPCIGNLNTSYVIVYLSNKIKTTNRMAFKYILCYCLSIQMLNFGLNHDNLNTSYVIVYQLTGLEPDIIKTNLNTSYVIVYLKICHVKNFKWRFKYILCYCLSSRIYALLTPRCNLNTSYVIVYHIPVQLSLCYNKI